MPSFFPKVPLDFVIQAEFNKSSGDVGPGTARPVRYSRGQFLAMVKRYFLNYRGGHSPAWFGPCLVDYTLTFEGDSINDVQSASPGASHAPMDLRLNLGSQIQHPSAPDDFSLCPFLDGEAPPREPASVVAAASATGLLGFSLFNPYSLEAGWQDPPAGATPNFWVQFSLALTASKGTSYVCSPSGDHGGFDDGPLSSNFLGIDYAGGSAFPSATSSIPLGDGTTEAFFLDPGGTDKVIINDLQTTNFSFS